MDEPGIRPAWTRGPRRSLWTRRSVLRTAGLAGATGILAGITPHAAFGRSMPAVRDTAADLPHDPADRPTKTAATFYTPDKVDAARRNVADHAWAAKLRDDAVATAQPYLDAGDDWLWALPTGQGLPRSYAVNQDLGSPITGQDIYQYGNYPWRMDVFEQPWKLTDPSSDYVFPTNDFGAFYRSGLNERGEFDRSLADESLLVNELYPERGETWGVDDGFGWIDDNGDNWTFIAYYVHWALWYNVLDGGGLTSGIRALRDAYLYTGEPRYARAGLILLDRVADLYPSMDTEPYKREDGYFHSDGLSGNGRVVGCIWETGLIRDYIYAYDAFFPAIADADTADVVPFLRDKAQEHGLPPKESVDDIRLNVENGVLRETCKGVLSAKIFGNFGMHQHTLAAAAVVLDDPDASPAWIDFVFASGGRVRDPEYHVTGGAFYQTLVDKVDRDGSGDEGAPGYNRLWIGHVQSVADVLAGYTRYPQADLYEHPKYSKMFQMRYRLPMLGAYTPSIGDSGQTGKPGLFGSTNDHVAAFERYGDIEHAQLAYIVGDGDVDQLYSDVFALDVSGTQERIADAIAEHGTLDLPSENLTGFGFAALRAGDPEHARAAWIYYGRSGGHGHRGTLNLGLYGYGVDLAPDLGYPEYADNGARRHEWTANTIAHNTVVVDAAPQGLQWVSIPRGFGATDRVQMVDIAAPRVYPQTSVYRRVTAQVAVNAANSYTVDVFRVVGGRDHRFSFHAAEGAATADGLALVPQAGAAGRITYPWRTPSRAGDYGALTQEITVEAAESHQLAVRVRDDYTGGTAGYHVIQVLIDDAVVAERDVAGGGEWAELTADVTEQLAGKTTATLTLRVYEKRGVGNFGVMVLFDDVSLTGATVENGGFEDPDSTAWQVDSNSDHFAVDARVEGSYAGPGIAPPPPEAPQRPGVNGFDWLGNVERDEAPPSAFSVDWSVVDTYDVGAPEDLHLRMHALHDADDVALADGVPPRNKPGNPESLRYVISHRHSEEELVSQFISVLEPYVGTASIAAVERVEVTAIDGAVADHEVAAVKVDLADGRTDYVISCARPDVKLRVDGRFTFRGAFGVCSWRDGAVEYGFTHGADELAGIPALSDRPAALTGTLEDFTTELSHTNLLTVELDNLSDLRGGYPGVLAGADVYVENDGERNAVYRIRGVRPRKGNRVVLDIGDVTLIRGYVDPEDFEQGFRYDVERGARVSIPLTREWSAA
ncbi:heparinase II/III domain-containing protein [Phytoactinopolyspora halotolerans]|uniref:heparinase II/III domain-containing protein n=1 Tax=Phytoactinopolyspora halotolerans TaxID=1981512 RepID=UPI001C20C2EB|nr:heparinase II/III family protein [Phytoactinopolyspora halotolerans]